MSVNKIKNTKKYTVKRFLDKYNGTNVKQTKEAFIEEIMNPHYVPYETKITICEKIIESSYYKKSEDREIRRLHINSPAQYMLYCLFLVKQYTNIEVDFSNSLEEFNLLNENDLLDEIYSRIPEKEIKEFRMILDMVESDVVRNEYELHAFINNQAERFGELFGYIAKPALDRLGEVLEDMDEGTIDKLVNKLKGLKLKEKISVIK